MDSAMGQIPRFHSTYFMLLCVIFIIILSFCCWTLVDCVTHGLLSTVRQPPTHSNEITDMKMTIKGQTIQPKLDRTDPVKSAASESAIQYRSRYRK